MNVLGFRETMYHDKYKVNPDMAILKKLLEMVIQ